MSDPNDKQASCRLLLLCHAATEATRRAAFAADEPAEARDLETVAGLRGVVPGRARVLSSPALCARQTADALGRPAVADPALLDCDWGRWRGRTLDEVVAEEPNAVASWLADPDAAPHGGESLAALRRRVAEWMDAPALAGPVLAVTHAAVIRAAVLHALGAPGASFWRLDVAPISLIELRRGPGGWSLRAGTAGSRTI